MPHNERNLFLCAITNQFIRMLIVFFISTVIKKHDFIVDATVCDASPCVNVCVCVCFVVRPSSSFVTFTVRPLTWFALDIYIFFSAFNGVHTHLFVPYIGFYAPKMSKTIFR